jgi:hypothetical protein
VDTDADGGLGEDNPPQFDRPQQDGERTEGEAPSGGGNVHDATDTTPGVGAAVQLPLAPPPSTRLPTHGGTSRGDDVPVRDYVQALLGRAGLALDGRPAAAVGSLLNSPPTPAYNPSRYGPAASGPIAAAASGGMRVPATAMAAVLQGGSPPATPGRARAAAGGEAVAAPPPPIAPLTSLTPPAAPGMLAGAAWHARTPAQAALLPGGEPPRVARMSAQLADHLLRRATPAQLAAGAQAAGVGVVSVRPAGDSGKVEERFADGSRVVRFRNGTEKEQRPDGVTIVRFNTGDVKRTGVAAVPEPGAPSGTVTATLEAYYYHDAATLHTTYALPAGGGGSYEVFAFPSGQVELHRPGGAKEIIFPDGSVKAVAAE